MHFDESGVISLSADSIAKNPLFILGGRALFESDWESLQKRMDNVVNRLSPRKKESVELHFPAIRKGTDIRRKFSAEERRDKIYGLSYRGNDERLSKYKNILYYKPKG
ncbi:MAG: hypothetical protein Kow0090_06710 [Myxococcota bacterium]